jgi:hypothetical protein
MTYANAIERQALISGFRELAGFPESNPGVPAPKYAGGLVFPPHASDADNRREIGCDRLAKRLGNRDFVRPLERE